MRAFLLGNLCLTEPGRHYLQEQLTPALRKAGIKLCHGWGRDAVASISAIGTLDPASRQSGWRLLHNNERFQGEAMMRKCDFVVAVLDGTGFDRRVVFEVEYALAQGRRVMGLNTDVRPSRFGMPSSRNDEAERLILESGNRIATSLDELVAISRELRSVTLAIPHRDAPTAPEPATVKMS